MIRTVNYSSVDRIAMRHKGWKWFGVVLSLQLLMIVITYFVS
ncbi:MAG: KGW motif small protein [Acinetobacter sp.]